MGFSKRTPGNLYGWVVFNLIIWTVCYLLWGSPAYASAPMPWILEKLNIRPNPSVPTEVQVALDIISITQIDERDENFSIHAIYDIGWNDPRLAFDPERYQVNIMSFEEEEVIEVLEALWWPDLNFHNSYSKSYIENRVLLIYSDGRVRLHMAIDANLRYQPDLSHLPFDKQVLPIVVEAFRYTTEEIILTPDHEHSGYEANVMPAHWNAEDMSQRSRSVSTRHEESSVSQVVFELSIRRDWRYFLWRVFFPMALIVAFSWSVFWLSPQELTSRIELGIIFMLTIMAFSLGFGDHIPKISYLTFLDTIFISMLLIIFFSGVESLVAHHLYQKGKESSALTLDRRCRILVPLSIVGIWTGLHLLFFVF